ncbi:recombinase RecA [bacterium]|nr:MAG: recombinase RecA [bacterium]
MKESNGEKKKRSLELALAQIEKQFGKGSIMRLGAKGERGEIGVIPTGSLALDSALGIGGIPRGRVTEIYGQESSGKTTLALHIIAEAQKIGGIAAFVDAEHALDPKYARALGVDTDNLLISQPDYGEQALEIAEALTRSAAVDVVVVDSVAALVPRQEIEGTMSDTSVGLQARLMSKALRKLSGAISKSNTSVVFINQTRMKIGVMYGNPRTTSGGTALKFYSSIRIEVKKAGNIGTSDSPTGIAIIAKVVKNKLAPPFRTAKFDIIYGEGISHEGELLSLGSDIGIINKSGTWYSYGDTRLGQGYENARIFLKEHPQMREEIAEKIRHRSDLCQKRRRRRATEFLPDRTVKELRSLQISWVIRNPKGPPSLSGCWRNFIKLPAQTKT